MSDLLTTYDAWLQDGGPAALVIHEQLESVDGTVIYPPTFAPPSKNEKGQYNIDRFGVEFKANANWSDRDDRGDFAVHVSETRSDANVCLINTVGAEANRTEVVFRPDKCGGKYASLVPQIIIEAGTERVNLLDAGHRAGDAIIRFTPYGEVLWDAFQALLKSGNAEPLAKAAPTSIVFGVWDSRGTQVKLPRVFRSVIRAFNVRELTRNSQFSPAVRYTALGLVKEELDKGQGDENPLSRDGFNDNPAGRSVGGVIVDGEIRREMSINLAAIRRLSAPRASLREPGAAPAKHEPVELDLERTMALRRYILGLSLVAATARTDERYDLREGCHLRTKTGTTPSWTLVRYDGTDEPVKLTESAASNYAEKAAKEFFGPNGAGRQSTTFDSNAANKWLALGKKEQEKRRRKDPMTKQLSAPTGDDATPTETEASTASRTRRSRK
jgi:CRISPR-associated protein Csb1